MRDALTGSVLKVGFDLEDVLPLFTSHTADALKLERKGRLREGADADVALLDADTLAVTDVFAGGRQIVKGGCVVDGEAASDDPPSSY